VPVDRVAGDGDVDRDRAAATPGAAVANATGLSARGAAGGARGRRSGFLLRATTARRTAAMRCQSPGPPVTPSPSALIMVDDHCLVTCMPASGSKALPTRVSKPYCAFIDTMLSATAADAALLPMSVELRRR
jgi:hypothetical protein